MVPWLCPWDASPLLQVGGTDDVVAVEPRAWHSHGDPSSVMATIVAPIKNAYIANQVAVGRAQLVRTSARLTARLNAIEWE